MPLDNAYKAVNATIDNVPGDDARRMIDLATDDNDEHASWEAVDTSIGGEG